MKKISLLVLAVVCCITACSKKEPVSNPPEPVLNDVNQHVLVLENIQDDVAETKDFRYVNAREGLRVRKAPGLDAEKVGFLENREKVEVISETKMTMQIGMLYSSWVEIKTESGLTGFVYGGYLEKSLNDVELIQKIEGRYADASGENFVTIEPMVNQRFRIRTNYPMFEKVFADINWQDIFTKNLFFARADGSGGIGGSIAVKFNEKGKLVFIEDLVKCEFDDDLNIVNRQKNYSEVILEKVSDTAEENPRILQDYRDSFPSEKANAYRDLALYFYPKRDFIIKNTESEETEDGAYFYKGNYILSTSTIFVNNELLEDGLIKIGSSKSQIYDLLGVPFRIIREKKTDYMEYSMNFYMDNSMNLCFSEDSEGSEEENVNLSTSICFYFDDKDLVSEINFSAEGF